MGIAIGASIQLNSLTQSLRAHLPASPDKESIITSILHSKSAIHSLPPDTQSIAVEAYREGLDTVWWILGFVAIVTLCCSMGIREIKMPEKKKIKRRIKGSGGGVVDAGLGEGLGVANGHSR